ncbi:hypothetical protein OUZ56_024278 [Daphnia magna]|uniref:Uncharacterized protein n=1 Tax=Daphnia magna TaxID=35525 RepID=A0ABR0B0I0_9CRUS|nr:hypothetical protein OUZ56_024278 [Daphnia magna]
MLTISGVIAAGCGLIPALVSVGSLETASRDCGQTFWLANIVASMCNFARSRKSAVEAGVKTNNKYKLIVTYGAALTGRIVGGKGPLNLC